MSEHAQKQIATLVTTGVLMLLGLALFKWVPMQVFGTDILFDASAHITLAMFGLYVLWFFVDQEPKLRTPFFVLCAIVLTVISMQRIAANAHNDIGLLGGFVISIVSIYLANPKLFKGKFRF